MRIHYATLPVAIGLVATSFLGVPALAQTPAAAPAVTAPAATPSAVTAENQPGFTVVGLSVRTDNQKEAGGSGLIPPMWQHAMQEGVLENVPHRADNNLTVVYTDYTGTPGEFTYVLGVRVSSVDKVPEGMVAVKVPAARYAVVESEKGSLPEVLPKVWHRIATMAPAELGGQRAFKADYEIYPEGFDWQDAQIPIYIGLK